MGGTSDLKKFPLVEGCRWGVNALFYERTTRTTRTSITVVETTVSNKIPALTTKQKIDWKRIDVDMV